MRLKKHRFLALTVLAFAVLFGFGPLTARASGLVVTPGDGIMFDISNMTPGDKASAKLSITNTHDNPIRLSVRAVDLHDDITEGKDLAEALIVKVYENGAILPGFPPLRAYPIDENYIYDLGVFSGGSARSFVFEVELPAWTGNEYLRTSARLRWVFEGDGLPAFDAEPILISKDDGASVGEENQPLGVPDIKGSVRAAETPAEPIIQLRPDDSALGVPSEMPVTGEAPLWPDMLLGAALTLFGGVILLGRRRKGIK